VDGPGLQNPEGARLLVRWLFRLLMPLMGRWVTVPPEVCRQRIMALASPRYPPARSVDSSSEDGESICIGTNGKAGGGAYALSATGDSNNTLVAYSKVDKVALRENVWHRTLLAFSVIAAGESSQADKPKSSRWSLLLF